MKYRISKVGEISKDLERKQGHLCTKKKIIERRIRMRLLNMKNN